MRDENIGNENKEKSRTKKKHVELWRHRLPAEKTRHEENVTKLENYARLRQQGFQLRKHDKKKAQQS